MNTYNPVRFYIIKVQYLVVYSVYYLINILPRNIFFSPLAIVVLMETQCKELESDPLTWEFKLLQIESFGVVMMKGL